MATRIRTVKPELARHDLLFEMERDSGIPFRFIWAMWPTVCDREGRFRWKPAALKPDVVPYDEGYDLSRVMDALATRGMFVKYSHENELFGAIPTFPKHQVVNNRERQSAIPSHKDENSKIIKVDEPLPTRDPRVLNAWLGMLFLDQGELEGKGTGIGSGTGRERELVTKSKKPKPTQEQIALNSKIWEAYRSEYLEVYQVEPVRNTKVNSVIKQIGERLGAEAPEVVRFFVNHPKSFYVQKLHDIGLCLAEAEAVRTQWARGKAITEADVRKYADGQARKELYRKIAAGEI